jgi:hypothetical protein
MPEQDQRLEQRIKTLEYEFKILKNEIQRTLLDIQEQVLIHYYPNLRAAEPSTTEDVKHALDSLHEKQAPAGAQAATPGQAASGEASAPVKKVTLEEIRKTQQEGIPAAAPEEAPAEKKETIDQTTLTNLSSWVSSSVAKIGSERTRKLLDVTAQRGYLAPDVCEVLGRLTMLGVQADPQEKVATNDILHALLRLNELLGRAADAEQALSLIDEAKLG